MESQNDSRLEELLDREAIRECLVRYCRGLDRGDLDMARSAYHEDARDDHLAYIGSGHGLVEWADEVHRSTWESHQHYVTNISIELDGDTAHTETYYFVAGRPTGTFDVSLVGGRYIDRFERRAGDWKIAARVCTLEWDMDPETAAQAIPLSIPATRDLSDPSWQRPLQVERPDRVLFGPGSEAAAHS